MPDNSKIDILVAEDTDLWRISLTTELEKAGFKVRSTSSGEQALDLLRTLVPKIFITDLMLPGIEGQVLCKFIKKTKKLAHIKTMVLSGVLYGGLDKYERPFVDAAIAKGPINPTLEKCLQVARELFHISPDKEHGGDVILPAKLVNREITSKLIRLLHQRDALLQGIAEAAVQVNEGGIILTVNQKACALLELEETEMLGQKFQDVFGVSGESPISLSYKEVLASKNKKRTWFQDRILGRDVAGSAIRLSVPSLNDCILFLFEDLTSNLIIKHKLQATEEKLGFIFEGALDAIIVIDSKGNILEANEKARNLINLPAETLTKKKLTEILSFDRDQLVKVKAAFSDALKGKRIKSMEITFRVNGDKKTTMDIAVFPLKTHHDKQHVIIFGRDITEKKLAIARFHELEAELRQAQKMEAIGRLAGGIAHDFNNILTTIKGYTQLLLTNGALTKGTKLDLLEIEHATDRASSLTSRLLTFARRQVVKPRTLDPLEVINGLEQFIVRTLGEDIKLKVDSLDKCYKINIDPVQLEQIIMNLTVNSRDAMPAGGEIVISVRNIDGEKSPELISRYLVSQPSKTGLYVEITVKDTGCGIPKKDLKHVFEPFFTTKEVGKGSGLGLSTVYGIVKQCGGYVRADNRQENGTIVSILLPATTMAQEPRQYDSNIAETNYHSSGKIFLVEDDSSVLNIMKKVLLANGYDVATAENGEEALLLIETSSKQPDLLITDVVMPSMSGLELVSTLKDRGFGIKVIFISGYPDIQLFEKGITLENEKLLPKPFSPKTLLSAVYEALG
ncbi:MAG: response regulator [Deltaproteobacteria bacterium]|nr:response regulator [Deltaproteobacteria bacterium]